MLSIGGLDEWSDLWLWSSGVAFAALAQGELLWLSVQRIPKLSRQHMHERVESVHKQRTCLPYLMVS